MELIFLGVACYFAYLGVFKLRDWMRDKRETLLHSHYIQNLHLHNEERSRNSQVQAERERLRRQELKRQHWNLLGRHLQLALQQVGQDPDAQRIKSWALQCRELPVDFRRRQFSRFQPIVREQIPRWLANGVDREALLADLRSLAASLGVASFEAEYMMRGLNIAAPTNQNEAQQFATRLSDIQLDHQRRMDAINAMPDLNDEVREELKSAEEQRFRGLLFGNSRRDA